MKKLNIILTIIFAISTFSFAEEGGGKQTKEFFVDGVCEMCKKRIENACYDVKGVKYATWDIPSKTLKVIYKDSKVSQKEIELAITQVGHDTENFTSPDSSYNKVHNCCKYREMDSH